MKRPYKEHFIALLAFTFLAVIVTFPVIFHMNTDIAGTGGDPWQTMWRFNAKTDLLYDSTSFFGWIAHEFLGAGEAGLANLSVWPWMPLHLLLGQPLAYNVIWLLHFVLAGYAMALLVKILTKGTSILESAPLLAGIAYMAMPYHVAQSLGHFGAMQLEWIPFIVSACIVLVRKSNVWKALLLGILLTIQAWTEHHYIVWLTLFALIAAFVYRGALRERFSNRKNRIPILFLLGVIIVGIVLPFIPTIRLAAQDSGALDLGIEQTIRFSADLFSFITPPPFHPLWGNLFNTLFGQYFTGNTAESVQYLGISIILAVLFFHRHIPVRQKRLWVITIIVFGVMSLGPVLHVFGKETSLPLPHALLANLPVFSAIRVISRAGVMVSFATVVLFGWVVATNKHRPRTMVAIAAILLLEFAFVPFPMQSAKLSPVYDALSGVSGSSVIEIPAATNYVAASRGLYASSFHKKEVLGNIALERGQSADAYQEIKSTPGVRQLLYLRTTELSEKRNEFFNQSLAETLPDAMKHVSAQAIIVHTDSLSALQNAAIANFLESNPGFTKQSFGDAILYTFNEARAPKTDGVFVVRGDGWENVGYDPKKNSVFGEIPTRAGVSVINVLDHPVVIELSFTLPSDSSSDMVITDQFGNLVKMGKAGDHVLYVSQIEPGVTSLSFSSTGAEKIIIQNPELRVTSN